MRRALALAVVVFACITTSALAAPAAAPDSAPTLAEIAADLFPAEPTHASCIVISCAEVNPCPCEYPPIVLDEYCEDEEGRLWALARCNPTDRRCQTNNQVFCS
jgi:hypothetical protein